MVADGPDPADGFLVDVLQVGDRRQAARAPGHEGLAAIGKAGVPESLERDPDRPCAALVHGEPQPAPVGARAEPVVLVRDRVARLVHEPPHPLDVAVAAERGAGFPLPGQDAVEDELGGNARVIHAREPERVVASHPVIADQRVLDRRACGVSEVERAGDVRRRLDDDERLSAGRWIVGGAECIGRHPALVDRRLDGRRVVARCQLASRRHRPLQTNDPLVEGRTGRGTTFVRERPSDPRAVASLPRYRADPLGSRATFSLSCPVGLSAVGPASLGADRGVLLTVVAVARSVPPTLRRPFGGRSQGTRGGSVG